MRNDAAGGLQNRIVIAAVVAIAAVAAFAALGGVGLAKSAIGPAQYGKKVTICHKGKNTMTISAKAWPAHQRHDDTLGVCTTTHKANKGKHKGESHHAPNPASGSGDTGSSSTSTTEHGKSGQSHGNNGGND